MREGQVFNLRFNARARALSHDQKGQEVLEITLRTLPLLEDNLGTHGRNSTGKAVGSVQESNLEGKIDWRTKTQRTAMAPSTMRELTLLSTNLLSYGEELSQWR